MHLIITEGPGRGQRLVLGSETVRLGRDRAVIWSSMTLVPPGNMPKSALPMIHCGCFETMAVATAHWSTEKS